MLHADVLSPNAALLRADDTAMLGGWSWDDVLAAALAEVAAGPPARAWGEAHRPRFRHPLSPSLPAASRYDPPSFPIGGDGDTVMAVGIVPAAGPAGTYGALCRYVIDVGEWDNSRWVVFGGASGNPESPHYADQTGRGAPAGWCRCATGGRRSRRPPRLGSRFSRHRPALAPLPCGPSAATPRTRSGAATELGCRHGTIAQAAP